MLLHHIYDTQAYLYHITNIRTVICSNNLECHNHTSGALRVCLLFMTMSSFRKENLTERDHLLNSSISDKDKETRLSWLTKLWRTNCCPWIKCRVVITIMCFLGFCNVYALRVNLSLAIVVMVNDTEAVSQPHKVGGCKTHEFKLNKLRMIQYQISSSIIAAVLGYRIPTI